jgi:hypothetical protein
MAEGLSTSLQSHVQPLRPARSERRPRNAPSISEHVSEALASGSGRASRPEYERNRRVRRISEINPKTIPAILDIVKEDWGDVMDDDVRAVCVFMSL